MEEEVAFGGDLLARSLCHPGCHFEQSLLIFAALWCDVDVLVCARELDGTAGRQSTVRLEVLGEDYRHQLLDRCYSTRNHSSRLGPEGQSDGFTRAVQRITTLFSATRIHYFEWADSDRDVEG